MRKIYVFLFDGFSDWELAYLTPEINKSEQFELIYFSVDGKFVKSMGGLQVKPTSSFKEIDTRNVELLILPGGTVWEKREINAIDNLLKELVDNEKSIAAICGATFYLGQLGLLDNVLHTSNDLGYLKAVVPEYNGQGKYQNQLALTDKNIITANGIAPIEFAVEIFKKIQLKPDDEIEKWFQLFKNGIWSE
ncbi:type 1 glutamine amidotransferase family protein [Flammeovirga aprica]|uniref:Glutamine amidotransferase n=1 Tax=Flammeovirga aprica JL-4 TaxID=694437 RepID=A0A7X9S241_9BACT|nr:type 1 glutamine amidotransferase family protein [Flammeovirga aprica]NME72980.1 glutamine amidotransferase [Flammeovirga aprica JL-4]